jgi:hypothetical protein
MRRTTRFLALAGRWRRSCARDVALPPYFGYGRGVTFYTWTSDQSNQYGVKVTISTLRDAPCVLDEILDNETELPIVEHATDTAGFTELVFGLFDLLGLQFSPRIRDLEQLSSSLSRQGVTRMGKPSDCIVVGNGLDRQAHRFLERFVGAGPKSPQYRLDLGERLLDGREIG